MYSKTKIYNVALSELKLAKQIDDADTDQSREGRVLNLFWDIALNNTLQDLDLDHTAENVQLQLITTLTDDGFWRYVYRYPTNCAFFRRIVSMARIDNSKTHVAKKVALYQGEKAIFTNEYQAYASIIPNDLNLGVLNAMGGLAIAQNLAILSAPLITGKGAKTLQDAIEGRYRISINKSQEADRLENFNYDQPYETSEWVNERMS